MLKLQSQIRKIANDVITDKDVELVEDEKLHDKLEKQTVAIISGHFADKGINDVVEGVSLEKMAERGPSKKWKAVLLVDGKQIDKTIELGPQSDKQDVMEQINREGIGGEVISITEASIKKAELYESHYETYKDDDGGLVYKIPFEATDHQDLVNQAKTNEELYDFLTMQLGSDEGLETINGKIFWGQDIQDFIGDEKGESKKSSVKTADEDITIYDNGGETVDRYTIFIGNDVYGMSNDPSSPQGFNQYSGPRDQIEPGEHLGKEVKLDDVSDDVKSAIRDRAKDDNDDGGLTEENLKNDTEMKGSVKFYSNDTEIPITVHIKDNAVNKVTADFDKLEKLWGVTNWIVTIPNRGKFRTESISAKTAIRNVLGTIFKENKELIMNGQRYTKADNNWLESNIDAIEESNIKQADEPVMMSQPTTVVEEHEAAPSYIPTSDGTTETTELPFDLGDMPEEEVQKVIDGKETASLTNQCMIKIEEQLTNMGIPETVEDVEITDKDDKSLEGNVTLTGDMKGKFYFTASVVNGEVKSVEPKLDLVKGFYGVKVYEATLPEVGTYQVETLTEKNAMLQVLGFLKKKFGSISHGGNVIDNSNMNLEADKLVKEGAVKAIKVFTFPEVNKLVAGEGNTDFENSPWEVLQDKEGSKFLVRKDQE